METGVEQKTIRLEEPPEVEAEMLMAAVHGAMLSARVNNTSILFRQITASAIKRVKNQKT